MDAKEIAEAVGRGMEWPDSMYFTKSLKTKKRALGPLYC